MPRSSEYTSPCNHIGRDRSKEYRDDGNRDRADPGRRLSGRSTAAHAVGAVTDLGQLLSASVEPSDTTLHVAGIQAIIDGYCAHRMVSQIERDLLPDALCFHILVTLAGAFEQRSRPDYQPTQRFWGATYAEWARHERRATRIVDIAQARLDALLAADV